MFIITLVMGLVAVIVVYISYQIGVHIQGLKMSKDMLIQMLPLLVFAIVMAGAARALIPSETITKWIGVESGFRGIWLGTIAGSLTPGGPFVSLPIAAGLLRMGASVGTMVAYLTAWSLIGLISTVPMQLGLMGWKFTLIRLACTFFFAPIAGLLANIFFLRVKII